MNGQGSDQSGFCEGVAVEKSGKRGNCSGADSAGTIMDSGNAEKPVLSAAIPWTGVVNKLPKIVTPARMVISWLLPTSPPVGRI
jgi:hypothetical protein